MSTPHGNSSGQLCHQSAVRSLQLDDIRLTYVVDGAMEIAPAVFFPEIPHHYWQQHPSMLADNGRVVMSTGGLLVETAGHRVLIDGGFGDIQLSNEAGRINCGALLQVLATLGHSADDIDVFAFTHLHADHIGWAYIHEPAGPRPTFPNARYVLSAREWQPLADGVPPSEPAVARLIPPLEANKTLFADGDEIAPGITALVTPGHTPGHTSYIVTSATGQRIIAFGDAFHAPAQLAHPEWPSAADADSDSVLIARRRILTELEHPNTLGFGIHFGDQAFGRIVRDGTTNSPQWAPVPARVISGPPREFSR
jgi:glyoxylase-like metal-dependent hydrolase (beta-lactamase superfamily II)